MEILKLKEKLLGLSQELVKEIQNLEEQGVYTDIVISSSYQTLIGENPRVSITFSFK